MKVYLTGGGVGSRIAEQETETKEEDYVRSKSYSLKYQRFITSGSNDIGIRQLLFLIITQFCKIELILTQK